MGEQGDRTPSPRRHAGSGQASHLPLKALFRVARENPSIGGSPASSREPDRDEVGGGQPEATERWRGTKPAVPPWPTVIATTVRLWFRRHSPRLGRSLRRRWVITLAALAVTVLAVGGLTLYLTWQAVTTAPAARHQAARTGTPIGPTGQNVGAPGAAAAGRKLATATQAAAAWVAQQVSRDAIVACDPSMCPVLRAQGFPAENLSVLRPGVTDPLSCDVIVATQAVRHLFGSRLPLVYAPTVIASFGSGAARIDLRATAPHGAAAYQAALRSDWAARRSAAAELARNPRVHAAGAARQELLAGKVDSRLLITLAALAVSHSVNVVAFGGSAPGAFAGVPLREMDVSGTGSFADRSAELQRLRSFVLAQHPVFLPAQASLVRLAHGGTALRVAFGAPSPLGLLLGSPATQ